MKHYDRLQPYFGEKNIKSQYNDTDAFVPSFISKHVVRDFQTLEDLIDFSNLNGNHEIFSNKNTKVIGKYKIETLKKIWKDEFVCLKTNA